MKVFTKTPELIGKKIYRDIRLEKLKDKFNPAKISYLSIEFTDMDREICDCCVIAGENILDFIVEDMEKAEGLSIKAEDKETMDKVSGILNKEKLLYDELSDKELSSLKNYSFITAKPIIIWHNQEINSLLEEILIKAKLNVFLTVNKNEAKAWLIPKGADIISAASKIHTDLARGFIKAEVYNIKDLDSFKNTEDAKQRGLLKIVDRDYVVVDGDVIFIRFK